MPAVRNIEAKLKTAARMMRDTSAAFVAESPGVDERDVDEACHLWLLLRERRA